ncbi:unnamed protein product [Rhizoctonia solani]|uniref:Uncharacterized protein n=1 Tax=Rhizoctonia solani TaxID=456999 RepID=A0A8H3CKU9_9AGAM|nr:unnamed protein product [Rhizoctonia solani]
MAFNSKRKFDDAEELVQDTYVPVKHTKVAPITEPMVTEDVDMGSDDAPSPAPSLASLATTASSHNSPAYPHFDLYPFPTSGDGMDSNPAFDSMKHGRSDSTVGLMQPQTIASDFVHHGANCSQIPRLRIASHPGLDGRRSLWSHCIECGAVEMVSTS